MWPHGPKPPPSQMQKIVILLKNGGPADQTSLTRDLFPKGATLPQAGSVLDDLRALVQNGDVIAIDTSEHGITWRTYRVNARLNEPLKTPLSVVRSSH